MTPLRTNAPKKEVGQMPEKIVKFDGGTESVLLSKKQRFNIEPEEARDQVITLANEWLKAHPNAEILTRFCGEVRGDLVVVIWYKE